MNECSCTNTAAHAMGCLIAPDVDGTPCPSCRRHCARTVKAVNGDHVPEHTCAAGPADPSCCATCGEKPRCASYWYNPDDDFNGKRCELAPGHAPPCGPRCPAPRLGRA